MENLYNTNPNSKKSNKLNNELDAFLGEENLECTGNECKLKSKDGLVEVVNKKFITEDGRQLLM